MLFHLRLLRLQMLSHLRLLLFKCSRHQVIALCSNLIACAQIMCTLVCLRTRVIMILYRLYRLTILLYITTTQFMITTAWRTSYLMWLTVSTLIRSRIVSPCECLHRTILIVLLEPLQRPIGSLYGSIHLNCIATMYGRTGIQQAFQS